MCRGVDGNFYRYEQQDDNWIFINNATGETYNGGDTFIDGVISQFTELNKGTFGSKLLNDLATHQEGVMIWTGSKESDVFTKAKC